MVTVLIIRVFPRVPPWVLGVWGMISWWPWRVTTGDLNSCLPDLAQRKPDILILTPFCCLGQWGGGAFALIFTFFFSTPQFPHLSGENRSSHFIQLMQGFSERIHGTPRITWKCDKNVSVIVMTLHFFKENQNRLFKPVPKLHIS